MYWLGLFVVLLIIEILTLGLTTIWFALGALVALLFEVIGFGICVQWAAFLFASILLFAVTRPIAVKYFNQERAKTNAEALIGQYALVIEEIDTMQSAGRVEIQGMEWSAKTDEPDGKIAKDKVVVVDGIQGVKLIVREKEVQLC